MKNAVKSIVLVAAVMAVAIILPASAAMPAYTGADHTVVSYPATFWSKIGKTSTVTGKVIASSNVSLGLEGAYVAIVNASNLSEEYCNTTSDADGSYRFTDVSATYFQSPDPDNNPQYKIYAHKEPDGEGLSASFGIDAAATDKPMVVWVVIPVKSQNSSISGATTKATIKPSPAATPMPMPAENTPAPDDRSWSPKTIAIIAAVVALVLAGAYLYIRRK